MKMCVYTFHATINVLLYSRYQICYCSKFSKFSLPTVYLVLLSSILYIIYYHVSVLLPQIVFITQKTKIGPEGTLGYFFLFFLLLFDLYKKDLFKMFFRRHPNKNTFGQSAYECTWAHPYYLFLFLVFLEAQFVQQVLASTSSVTTV